MAERQKVELLIPRIPGAPADDVFISVNGENYLLPRGKKHKVPVEVKEEYERSVKATERFMETVDNLKKEDK